MALVIFVWCFSKCEKNASLRTELTLRSCAGEQKNRQFLLLDVLPGAIEPGKNLKTVDFL